MIIDSLIILNDDATIFNWEQRTVSLKSLYFYIICICIV